MAVQRRDRLHRPLRRCVAYLGLQIPSLPHRLPLYLLLMQRRRHPDTDTPEWGLSFQNGVLTIEMPQDDADEVAIRAAKAGLSVENYLRQMWGFPLLPDA